MKKLLLFLLVVISSACYGQNRDNIWRLCYQFFVPNVGIDFSSGIPDTFSVWTDLHFFATDASICDTNGNLLFYTNGCYIANRNNDSLENCNQFNPGWASDHYSQLWTGLGCSQGAIILPRPGSDSLYEIIHISGEVVDNGTQTQPLQLRYSEVDMTLDSGLGGVDNKKNITLVNDTLVWGRLTACKHANGRDWWIIAHRWYSDLYYKFLLAPDSIYGPFIQHIGSVIDKNDICGQGCFSPDGNKFCYVNANYNFDYMDFDRCTGEFSNAINITLPDSNLTQGCAFSEDSRFLYVNDYNQIFQFDTWANDLLASEIMVDTIPFHQIGQIPDWFAVEMLGPDNKIYISTYNGIEAMHVIDQPDSLGSACNFIRQGLPLPTYNSYAVPNNPNYDLGALVGSPCDTLNIPTASNLKPQTSTFRIYPNPTSDWLNIIYQTDQPALLEVFNVYGERVAAESLYPYFKNRLLDVSRFAPGLYNAVVTQQGKKIWSSKVVVE